MIYIAHCARLNFAVWYNYPRTTLLIEVYSKILCRVLARSCQAILQDPLVWLVSLVIFLTIQATDNFSHSRCHRLSMLFGFPWPLNSSEEWSRPCTKLISVWVSRDHLSWFFYLTHSHFFDDHLRTRASIITLQGQQQLDVFLHCKLLTRGLWTREEVRLSPELGTKLVNSRKMPSLDCLLLTITGHCSKWKKNQRRTVNITNTMCTIRYTYYSGVLMSCKINCYSEITRLSFCYKGEPWKYNLKFKIIFSTCFSTKCMSNMHQFATTSCCK